MGIDKKDLKCMSKNKKCMKCLKKKSSKKFISGKSIKGSTTMFDLHDYGCNKKCKSCKEEEKKGGGLPDVLIPLGLIVARGGVPKLVRSLKRLLTKKGGGRKRRRTVRKRRRTRKGRRTRRTRRTRRGGSRDETIEAKIESVYEKAGATKDMIKNDIEHIKKHYPGNLQVLLKKAQKSVSDALENATIELESLESPKSPKGKKKGIKTKGKRTKGKRKRTKRKTKSLLPCCIPCPPHAPDTDACLLPCQRCVPLKTKRKRTKGKRTKGKQRGGFMRGATRNFCTMKN